MNEAGESDVPDGAAVIPLIPAELAVNPLLLAVLHATIFLSGSDDEVVNGPAAEEALQYMADYLQRMDGDLLRRTREDMICLTAFARQENWPKPLVRVLKSFLKDYGVEKGEE